MSIGHYMLGKTLGEGTFGKVKLGTHILTGEKVAIKILEKSRIIEIADVERVSREISILKRISFHPNIIQMFEVIDTNKHIYLIMEYLNGGELFDHIVAKQRLSESEACIFLGDVLNSLEYLHSISVIHRDLKPENLLLYRERKDDPLRVKVIDFGLSNTCDGNVLLKTACGSPCYAPPEMIQGKRYDGSRTDIWSVGVILFAMVCGYLPFEDQNTSKLYQKILNCTYKPAPWTSDEVRHLLKKILEVDPRKRYTVDNIRRHPWFLKYKDTRATPRMRHNEINETALFRLSELGISSQFVVESLQKRAHNHATTTYYLLCSKLRRERTKQNNFSKLVKQGVSPAVAFSHRSSNNHEKRSQRHRRAPQSARHHPHSNREELAPLPSRRPTTETKSRHPRSSHNHNQQPSSSRPPMKPHRPQIPPSTAGSYSHHHHNHGNYHSSNKHSNINNNQSSHDGKSDNNSSNDRYQYRGERDSTRAHYHRHNHRSNHQHHQQQQHSQEGNIPPRPNRLRLPISAAMAANQNNSNDAPPLYAPRGKTSQPRSKKQTETSNINSNNSNNNNNKTATTAVATTRTTGVTSILANNTNLQQPLSGAPPIGVSAGATQKIVTPIMPPVTNTAAAASNNNNNNTSTIPTVSSLTGKTSLDSNSGMGDVSVIDTNNNYNSSSNAVDEVAVTIDDILSLHQTTEIQRTPRNSNKKSPRHSPKEQQHDISKSITPPLPTPVKLQQMTPKPPKTTHLSAVQPRAPGTPSDNTRRPGHRRLRTLVVQDNGNSNTNNIPSYNSNKSSTPRARAPSAMRNYSKAGSTTPESPFVFPSGNDVSINSSSNNTGNNHKSNNTKESSVRAPAVTVSGSTQPNKGAIPSAGQQQRHLRNLDRITAIASKNAAANAKLKADSTRNASDTSSSSQTVKVQSLKSPEALFMDLSRALLTGGATFKKETRHHLMVQARGIHFSAEINCIGSPPVSVLSLRCVDKSKMEVFMNIVEALLSKLRLSKRKSYL